MYVANERASNGDVPVDALLAALRRAAEQDGVEDVDAVVAEFATFVRAQAPQIASQRSTRRQNGPWATAALSAGVLVTAALGAVAGGVVANPFLPGAPDDAAVSAAADEPTGLDADATGWSGDAATGTAAQGDAGTGGVAAGGSVDLGAITSTDPDALAGIAELREEALAASLAEAPVTTAADQPAGSTDGATSPDLTAGPDASGTAATGASGTSGTSDGTDAATGTTTTTTTTTSASAEGAP